MLGVTALSSDFQPVSFTLFAFGVVWASLSSPEIHAIFPDAIAASGRHMLAANSLVLLKELATYTSKESDHFIVRCKPGVDEILFPGEPEYRTMQRRKRDGILVEDSINIHA